jgi:phage terminase large subunit-like protein
VDPPGTSKRSGAECGIIVAGRKRIAGVPHFYVLADLSLRGTPQQWGSAAVDAYHDWKADAIVAEKNYGGEMVANTIRTVPRGTEAAIVDANATTGKSIRAQPVSSFYQQGRGHHCGKFDQLELELCTWEPNAEPPMPSPNRLDALVWAAHDLILGPTQETEISIPALRRSST